MTATNEATLKLARNIYWQYMERVAAERGKQVAPSEKERCLRGDLDHQHGVQIALAAYQQATPTPAESFQARVQPWLIECFGAMIAGDREERNHRFLEEALELVQSLGCTAGEAHQLVDYTFGRPIGEPFQESGGVSVTHAALCLANKIDMDVAAETELARVWTKVEQIRAKQAAKPKYSPLPEAPTPAEPTDVNPDALAALRDGQRQLDMDGCEVGVSRQALDELLAGYTAVLTERDALARQIATIDASLERHHARATAAEAKVAALTEAVSELQDHHWTLLKDRRDAIEQAALKAKWDLEEAVEKGWNSHLPTLEEVRAALASNEGDVR